MQRCAPQQGHRAAAALGVDLLDHGLHGRHPGAARQHQQVAAGAGGQRERGADRGPHPQDVAPAGAVDQRRADRSPRHKPDVQVEAAVGPGQGGRRVVAPQPGALRCLQRDRLAGLVRQPVVGHHGEHGHVHRAPLVPHDLRLPPGRRLVGRGVGGVGHDLGHHPVGGRPVVRQLVVPGARAEVLQRGQQRRAHRRVVLAHHRELAMVAPQRLEQRHQPLQVVDAADHLTQRGHQLVALVGHADREQLPDAGVGQEQRRVEEQGHLVAVLRDLAPVLLEGGGVHDQGVGGSGRSTISASSPPTVAPRAAMTSSGTSSSCNTSTRWSTTLP